MKKILLDFPNEEDKNLIFVREKENHFAIYIIDELEYSKFKTSQVDEQIININCRILECIEKINELVYSLERPIRLLSIPSDKIESFIIELN